VFGAGTAAAFFALLTAFAFLTTEVENADPAQQARQVALPNAAIPIRNVFSVTILRDMTLGNAERELAPAA
jgi:hypothetical protein